MPPTTMAFYHDGGAAKTKEIERMWKDADADGNGTLDRSEVAKVLGLLTVADDEPNLDQAVDQAMVALDKDGDGNIVFSEFATWYLKRDESAEQIETTVAGLAELAESGALDDETYVWVDGLGDDWLLYGHVKQRLAGAHAAEPPAVLPTTMAYYQEEVDGDESGEQVETTVAGLAELAANGQLHDETYVWIDGLGDDWHKYIDVKKRLVCESSSVPGSQSVDPQKLASSDAAVTFDVVVPNGVNPGDTITLELADGREIDVVIPEGHRAGDEFEVELDTNEEATPVTPLENVKRIAEGVPGDEATRMPEPQPVALSDGVELQTHTLNAVCPEGVRSGETIAIQYENHAFDVLIPDGVQPGEEFEVQIEI